MFFRSIHSRSQRIQKSACCDDPHPTAFEVNNGEPGVQQGNEFRLERYKYILQQIHTVNENVYRFLAIYQALAVALVSGGLTLFVGYRRWNISALVARDGIVGLLVLLTMVAGFTALLVVIGILNWLDYRREECELTDVAVYRGFRKPPSTRNFFRWYETYILLFIVGSAVSLWACALICVIPAMH
jgi:hypothetical protein